MKTSILSLILFSQIGWSHCPTALELNGAQYCLGLEWLEAEQKVGGELQPKGTLSPIFNYMGAASEDRLYSRAVVRLWKLGDSDHTPVYFDSFRVFNYMFMSGGHHHLASMNWQWDSVEEAYIISELNFREMKGGCWVLRWTVAAPDAHETSTHLMSVIQYSNLGAEAQSEQEMFCERLGVTSTESVGHSH